MEDKPRYSRVSDILDLIIFMLSRFNGVSLNEIQERYNISRRTAERMRDAVLVSFSQVDEIETDDRCKRWGFTNYSLNELVTFSNEDIALLENLKKTCDNLSQAEIENIVIKMKALKHKFTKIDDEKIELILQSEGYAIRQTQNFKVDLAQVSVIRQAIKEKKKLQAEYHDKIRILEPLGLYNYVLHKLKNVKLTNETFDSKDFNLQEYSQKSFGVYFGEIYDVKLKFIPEAAEDVMNYNFHPTQKINLQDDGSVIVTFKASGDKHIMWNLFKWGNSVEILAPKELKYKYRQYLNSIIIK